jgi:hypothetical protein
MEGCRDRLETPCRRLRLHYDQDEILISPVRGRVFARFASIAADAPMFGDATIGRPRLMVLPGGQAVSLPANHHT